MKIIDFERNGNQVKFYVGNDNCDNYWGDDWDDKPYKHNAGKVYNEFILGYFIKTFDFDDIVEEPFEEHYHGYSKYSKQDMKERKIPCICVLPKEYRRKDTYYYGFSDIVGDKHVISYYFGDVVDESKEHIHYVKEYEKKDKYLMISCPLEGKLLDVAAHTFAYSLKYGIMDTHQRKFDETMLPTFENLKETKLKECFCKILKSLAKLYDFDGDIDSAIKETALSFVGVNELYKGYEKRPYFICYLSGDVFSIGEVRH